MTHEGNLVTFWNYICIETIFVLKNSVAFFFLNCTDQLKTWKPILYVGWLALLTEYQFTSKDYLLPDDGEDKTKPHRKVGTIKIILDVLI